MLPLVFALLQLGGAGAWALKMRPLAVRAALAQRAAPSEAGTDKRFRRASSVR
jgi:hypothetical protein